MAKISLFQIITIFIFISFTNSTLAQNKSTEIIRAEALFQIEKYTDAAEIFNNHDLRDSWYKRRVVEVNWNAGNYAKMLKAIPELRSMDRGYGYFYLSRYYVKHENTDSAFLMMEKMLEERHKPSRSLIKTDSVLKKLKDLARWDSIWKLAHYNEYDLKVEMAEQELKVKNYDLALQLLDELIEDRPYKDKPWYLRSKLLFEQGVYISALDDINSAIKEEEREAKYYGLRAEIYLKLGRNRKAFKSAVDAIALSEHNPRWYKLAVRSGIEMEKYEDINNYADIYLNALPEDDKAHFYMAKIVFNTGSCLKALPHINRAIALQNRNPDYYFQRAQIYQKCKVYAQAIKDYNMCMDFWPRKAELYLGRGVCRHELGEKSASCRDLIKAYDLGSIKADELRKDWCN